MKRILFLLAFLGTAQAAEQVVVTPSTWELRDADSHRISTGHATEQICLDAAPASATLTGFRCVKVVVFTKVGVCDDTPPPVAATVTVIDPNPVGPYPGLPPETTHPQIEVLPDGSWKYTFNDVGTLVPALKPGSTTEYEFFIVTYEREPYPGCRWLEVRRLVPPPPPPPLDTTGAPPIPSP